MGVYTTSYVAFWRKRKEDLRFHSKNYIKEVLDFVIDNAYFHTSNIIIGIPMASDPAPFISNIFLCIYEIRFMNNLLKED